MPPGRTVMLLNSVSGLGLSTRATGVGTDSTLLPVRDDMSVHAEEAELAPHGPVLGVLKPPRTAASR